ncbi:MAG TPA: serine/threonine-protein kinase [Candidatus Eisenbacteria bacterium]|nr:serine/threonine-protein kinase [Candidatus Eisenbacteria bacterium]
MADPIDRVATAVSDGAAVDWVREKSRRPEHLESLEQLSVLERIRRAHDSVDPTDGSTEPAGEAEAETITVDVPARQETPLFRWGNLEVLEKIGEGSGGEVYRALDPTLKSQVALKLLRPDHADSPQLTQRFLDEGRRLARVRHANVLVVHGADRHDGRVGLWTEYLAGHSLEHVIMQHGSMSACEAAIIGLDLCRALAAVHAAGLIHRDVKTTNVMREEGGRIVLMDFGSVAESPGMGASAWTAGVQGTPIYMAPEQLRGEVAGPPTDVYGLGVLLYRLVTRRFPIEASSLSELSEKHNRGEQIPIRDRRPDLPLEFVRVVERALKSDPAERYATAGAMELDLAMTLGAMARREGIRRRFQGVAIAAIASIGLVAGVVIGYGMFKPAPAPGPDAAHRAIAAPAVPAPLTAEVTLMRRVGENEEPLEPGARIAPHELLSLLVRGNDSMYVYVLDEDAAGEVNGLYPIRGLDPANPLRAHMRHRLPGDLGGEMIHWKVTSAGGKESIVAIGSRRPLENLETAMAEIPKATMGRPVKFGRLNPMALRDLRGIGEGSALPPPAGEGKRRLNDALAGLREEGRKSGDVWVWSIDLENP